MKVALFGGTGFVGSYITDKLIESGHVPRILVREGSIQKVSSPDKCEIVEGDIADTNSILDVIKGVDAVIYTIGIIREIVRADVTYENLHFEGALNCVDMAEEYGVKRFILMSANGVSPNMNLASALFSSAEFRIAGTTVSRQGAYVAQIDTVEKRLHNTGE